MEVKMRFVTFDKSGKAAPGVLSADGASIADLSAHFASLLDIVEGGALAQAKVAVANAPKIAASGAKIFAPIPAPRRNIICVGKNYHEHAKEFHSSGFDASAGKDAIPDFPIIFSKASTTVIGPNDPVPGSADPTNSVDYEVELAVVIGKRCKNVPKAQAYDQVFGYMIVNDVTSRQLQARHKQWFLGKNLDGFCPMGPWLVSADEVGDVTKLRVTAEINGEKRQDALVKDLIFDIPTLIETITSVMTLLPGDIIATGTPAGVGIGFNPPKFLAKGDRMKLEITGLGVLENAVA
jgi:2-keto-4-pentenoate hydratase/2-oxohepta-3-ene-1,7-dioic acid hydratase in catechol pathway